MICMQRWSAEQSEGRFHIAFMLWETFFETIKFPENHSDCLKNVFKADLVIGGVDMSISYL
jgi:hypothetical protein